MGATVAIDGHNKLIKLNGAIVRINGRNCLFGFVDLVCLVGIIGIVGLEVIIGIGGFGGLSLISLVGNDSLIGCINLISLAGLSGISGLVDLLTLVDCWIIVCNGLVGICFSPNYIVNLVGPIGISGHISNSLVDHTIVVGLHEFIELNGLVGHIELIELISLVIYIGFIGPNGYIGCVGSICVRGINKSALLASTASF